jgi:hypothetical protein
VAEAMGQKAFMSSLESSWEENFISTNLQSSGHFLHHTENLYKSTLSKILPPYFLQELYSRNFFKTLIGYKCQQTLILKHCFRDNISKEIKVAQKLLH